MQAITTQERKAAEKHQSNKINPEKEVDLEMAECLSKLKIWQTENLMAPRGMDMFLSVHLAVSN